MKEIIKYQLKARKNQILFTLALFSVLSIVGYISILFEYKNIDPFTSGFSLFWIPLSIIVPLVVVLVMSVLCGSGHINELLFKDTNYLNLTIPRNGYQIIFGRFIAGLIEFTLYFVAMGVFFSIYASLLTVTVPGSLNPRLTYFFRILVNLYSNVFIANASFTCCIALYIVAFASLLGATLNAGIVASRSVLKNKNQASVGAIVIIIILLNLIFRFIDFIDDKINFAVRGTLKLIPDAKAFGPEFWNQINYSADPYAIPIMPLIVIFLVAGGLLVVSANLLEKKLEL